jgi:hypothetical protein
LLPFWATGAPFSSSSSSPASSVSGAGAVLRFFGAAIQPKTIPISKCSRISQDEG